MVKEWIFSNENDAIECSSKVNGIVGHNEDCTEWYVHAIVR